MSEPVGSGKQLRSTDMSSGNYVPSAGLAAEG